MISWSAATLLGLCCAPLAWSQTRVQFPQTAPTLQTPPPPATTWQGVPPGSATVPGASSTVPLQAPPLTGSSPVLGAPPPFDPYASGSSLTAPSLAPGLAPPPGALAPSTLGLPSQSPYAIDAGSYPPGAFPGQSPSSLFPNGIWGSPSAGGIGSPPMRLIYGPRMRYTWVRGDEGNPNGLDMNDFDFSAALALPNFLWTGRPIFVVPSFSLHLWHGPRPPNPADLPSRAYSAFIDAGWSTDPNQVFGGSVGVRTGLFTDFNTLNTDSLRIMGEGLFLIRATPTLTVKGGVIYTDRNRVKLVPAGGVLWEPNPNTRFDIYFPRPKLAQYLTTLGNQDIWWYVGAEYGGGSWTIERMSSAVQPTPFSDRIDINDFRVMLGVEWGQSGLMREGKRLGFIEAGFVWNREVYYVTTPTESFDSHDTFMLRAGIGY